MPSTTSSGGLRVALIHPNVPHQDLFDRLAQSHLPPLGVLYLASALRAEGHDVRVMDLNLDGAPEAMIPELRRFRPDVVGMGSLAPSFEHVVNLSTRIRERLDHDYTFVAGGADASVRPEVYADTELFDTVLVGEAEQTLTALCDALPQIPKMNGIVPPGERTSPPAAVIRPDDMPFPARDLLPLKRYRGGPAYKIRRHTTSIFTHRGCAYTCTFCEKGVHDGPMRFRSARSMFEEVREIVEKYGIRDIRFIDDVLMINRKILTEFCDLVIENGLRFDWLCCSRMDLMHPELLAKMRRAGCYRLELGVESGNDRILEMTKKGARTRQAIEAMTAARQAGIEVIANYIVGFPSETVDEMRETIDFSLRLKSDFAIYFAFVPYQGATIADQYHLGWGPLANGFRDKSRHYLVDTETVQGMVDRAYTRFYFRPDFIARRLTTARSAWLIADLARLAGLYTARKARRAFSRAQAAFAAVTRPTI
ncbi:MAG: B12-binding domain-containing radical SAM protein [Deltaproteobacteria bacterium]|nr:B12-binding domain-containing radical SAM protein [Deltaproteobacteria bacterium]MCB9489370.1 B12-binding domain-containing radical SAM protein [Deltaproteobacteria bacterium]